MRNALYRLRLQTRDTAYIAIYIESLQLSAMVGCLTPAEPDYVVKRLGTRKSLIRAAC